MKNQPFAVNFINRQTGALQTLVLNEKTVYDAIRRTTRIYIGCSIIWACKMIQPETV